MMYMNEESRSSSGESRENKKYICRVCGREFENRFAYASHTRSHKRKRSERDDDESTTSNSRNTVVLPIPVTSSAGNINPAPTSYIYPQHIQEMQMQPQQQQQRPGDQLLALLLSLMTSRKSKVEELLMESALSSLIKDIELAQKVKTLVLETPAKYLARGLGKYLEKNVISGEMYDEYTSLKDIIEEGFMNALKKLKAESNKFD